MMKRSVVLGMLLLIAGSVFAQGIIPRPHYSVQKAGQFKFTKCTRLKYDEKNGQLANALTPLVKKMKIAAGIDIGGKQTGCSDRSTIEIEIADSIENEEGYRLNVGTNKIHITAKTASGVYYAVQSLLQLLPAEIESTVLQPSVNWEIRNTVIRDAPRFKYRGVMLDVARHYMHVDSVKRLIDLLSMQKMNRLHWHLTDNDGWRFQSKKYPKLTEIGAYRKGSPIGNNVTYDYASKPDEALYGGYYTQEEMRDIVRYAADRFVTIVPEIEMPAHAAAAIAAYPFLSCLDSNGNAFPYPQQIQGEFCTKDQVFDFLNDILAEAMDIFPSKYIHIGGDEAEKENWKSCTHCKRRMESEGLKNVHELQSYFIRRIEKFVNSRGRNIIGWDEIMEGGIAPNAAVMSWTGVKNGMVAASKGHEVVMTPLPYCYFDHYQSDDPQEPLTYSGLTMLSNVYAYEPIPEGLARENERYILGAQGNLWTEYVPSAKKADYMLFPRSTALAEVNWSNPAHKNYDDFLMRLAAYKKRLDLHGVNYAKHMYDIRISDMEPAGGKFFVRVSGVPSNEIVRYTTDGTRPNQHSPIYKSPVAITRSCKFTAAVMRGGAIIDLADKDFVLHKGVGKRSSLRIAPSGSYHKGGLNNWHNGSLTDDVRINDVRYMDELRYNDDLWSCWPGEVFDGTIDFGVPENVSKVTVRFFHNIPHGAIIPKSVVVQVSNDGKQFTDVAVQKPEYPKNNGTVTVSMALAHQPFRYLRVIAEPYGKTPYGNKAWLFVDEVIVE